MPHGGDLRTRDLAGEAQAERKRREERLMDMAEILSQATGDVPLTVQNAFADLVETRGGKAKTSYDSRVAAFGTAIPSNVDLVEAAESDLPSTEGGTFGKVVGPALGLAQGAVGAGVGVAGAGLRAVGRGAVAVGRPVVSPLLDGLNWYSRNINEPLAAPLSVAINAGGLGLLPGGNVLETLRKSSRAKQNVTFSAELLAEYERRRIAGTGVDTWQDKLATWHAAARNYQEKQSMWLRLPTEAIADPLNFVPVGTIAKATRFSLDPITKVARVTAGGKFLTPQSKVNFAEGVTRDVVGIALNAPGPDGRLLDMKDPYAVVERLKSFTKDPTRKYSAGDFLSDEALANRKIPLKEQMRVVEEVLDLAMKNKKGEYEWETLLTPLGDETPNAHQIAMEIIDTGLNAYERKVGVKRHALAVTLTAKQAPDFPTRLASEVEVSRKRVFDFDKDGNLPKGWEGELAAEMRRLAPSADVIEPSELAGIKTSALHAGLEVSVRDERLNDGPNALLRLGYAFKRQMSPFYLFMNPGYWVANAGNNYGMAFLRHGLNLLDYGTYTRAFKEAGIDPGDFAARNYGQSKDALAQLQRGVVDDRAWVEKLPKIGNVPYGLRQWSQKMEQHAHLVHVVTGQGKLYRKMWGKSVDEMTQAGKITPQQARRLKNTWGGEQLAAQLKAGAVPDAGNLFPLDEIRNPLLRTNIAAKLATIREGSLEQAGRVVTEEDVATVIREEKLKWGVGGKDRDDILTDVTVVRGDTLSANSPLNQPLVHEPQLAETDAEKLAHYIAEAKALDEGGENFMEHVQRNITRRKAASDGAIAIYERTGSKLAVQAMARMSAEGTKAASLSFQYSQRAHQRLRGLNPASEEGKKAATNVLRALRVSRTRVNDAHTARYEKILADLEKATADMPTVAHTNVLPLVNEEIAKTASEQLVRLGLGHVDPLQTEDVGKMVARVLDDDLEDIEASSVAWRSALAEAAPPELPLEIQDEVVKRFQAAHTFAQRRAVMEAEHDLLNYGNKTSADMMMNWVSPYPFWATRFMLNLGTRFLGSPRQFEVFSRLVQQWYQDTKDLPPSAWFSENVYTTENGDEIRIRPWAMMFPLGYPAMELMKRGADSDTTNTVEDVVQSFQRMLGMNLYPYMEVAVGLANPSSVDASGYGVIRPPTEVLRSSAPLTRYLKTILGAMPDENSNTEMARVLVNMGMLNEADFNRAINLMREDVHKGLIGNSQEDGARIIEEVAAQYRRGEMSPVLSRYISKQFSERELWKLIPGVNPNVLSKYDRDRYTILRNAYQETDANTAPTVMDRQALAESFPSFYAGGRWKMPEKLPLTGRVRSTWEETNAYHYQLSQISQWRTDMIENLGKTTPVGREYIEVLQNINAQARFARQQAKAGHPLAAIDRDRRDELKRALGQAAYPVNPLDEAYEAYIAILEDPQYTNEETLEIDYKARQRALDAWETDHANTRGIALGQQMSAVEYLELRRSQNTDAVEKQYYDFVEMTRGYWEAGEDIDPRLLEAKKRRDAQPALYRNDPLAKAADRLISQQRRLYRARYIYDRRGDMNAALELERGLVQWYGYQPLWNSR